MPFSLAASRLGPLGFLALVQSTSATSTPVSRVLPSPAVHLPAPLSWVASARLARSDSALAALQPISPPAKGPQCYFAGQSQNQSNSQDPDSRADDLRCQTRGVRKLQTQVTQPLVLHTGQWYCSVSRASNAARFQSLYSSSQCTSRWRGQLPRCHGSLPSWRHSKPGPRSAARWTLSSGPSHRAAWSCHASLRLDSRRCCTTIRLGRLTSG
jgi:hypothetical protein